jgi:hypothetical protein
MAIDSGKLARLRQDFYRQGFAVVHGAVPHAEISDMNASIDKLTRRLEHADAYELRMLKAYTGLGTVFVPAHSCARPRLQSMYASRFEMLGPRARTFQTIAEAVTGISPLEAKHWAINNKPAECGRGYIPHRDVLLYADCGDAAKHSPERIGDVVIGVAGDPATVENGCLRLIPWSHRFPTYPSDPRGAQPTRHRYERALAEGDVGYVAWHKELVDRYMAPLPGINRVKLVTRSEFNAFGDHSDPVPLALGSAVIFQPQLVHGSAENLSAANRRMYFMTYAFARSKEPSVLQKL